MIFTDTSAIANRHYHPSPLWKPFLQLTKATSNISIEQTSKNRNEKSLSQRTQKKINHFLEPIFFLFPPACPYPLPADIICIFDAEPVSWGSTHCRMLLGIHKRADFSPRLLSSLQSTIKLQPTLMNVGDCRSKRTGRV